jgi:DNA-binding transcriptional regulator YiaG
MFNPAVAHIQDTPEVPAHGSVTAEKAVFEAVEFLREAWGLSGSALAKLLRVPVNTVNHWLSRKRIPLGEPPFDARMEALINLLAIHRSLHAMFSERENQLAWLKTPHPELGGVPIEKIRESFGGLLMVRQYLDYVRGRGA